MISRFMLKCQEKSSECNWLSRASTL